MKTITVNGEKYVSEADYKKKTTGVPTKKRIAVLQRGWVVIGDYVKTKAEHQLHNPAVIRAWGTTKGLGEIAEGGPTSSTKLDPCPTVRFELGTAVLFIDVNEEKWVDKY